MRVCGFFGIFLAFCAVPAHAAPIEGVWRTADGDALVAFERCEEEGSGYCGRFVWLKDDSAANPSLDERNADKALRTRPLCGTVFIGGLEADGAGERYLDGWIYSPRHGHSFSAEVSMQGPDSLVLRGYVMLPALGGSQTWTRVQQPEKNCFSPS